MFRAFLGHMFHSSVVPAIASKEDVHRCLALLAQRYHGVPFAEFRPEASLRGALLIDSVALVELLVAAEEELGVDASIDACPPLHTVQDLVDYLKERLAPAEMPETQRVAV